VADVTGGPAPAKIAGETEVSGAEETRFLDWPVPVIRVCVPAVGEAEGGVVPAPEVDEKADFGQEAQRSAIGVEGPTEVEAPRYGGPAQGAKQEVVLAATAAEEAPSLSATGSEESVAFAVSAAAVAEFDYTAAAHLPTLLVEHYAVWAPVAEHPFSALAPLPDSCHSGRP